MCEVYGREHHSAWPLFPQNLSFHVLIIELISLKKETSHLAEHFLNSTLSFVRQIKWGGGGDALAGKDRFMCVGMQISLYLGWQSGVRIKCPCFYTVCYKLIMNLHEFESDHWLITVAQWVVVRVSQLTYCHSNYAAWLICFELS